MLNKTELFNSQVAEYAGDCTLPSHSKDLSIVVLDDDPTGCQTVHDVPVLLTWDEESLGKQFAAKEEIFFVLVNTRSLDPVATEERLVEVLGNLKAAARENERELIVLNRSDSTLRGHYPLEPELISRELQLSAAMSVLIPAFFQGGRYTCDDVHYVMEGDELIPAGETPFAEDKTFGFRSSNLVDYVVEKHGGALSKEDVLRVSLKDIREGGAEKIAKDLLASDCKVCVVNAIAQSDLDVFALAVWEAIKDGKEIIIRTSASFINSFAGIEPKVALGALELRSKGEEGGLVVVGSHVPKTTAQLEVLFKQSGIIQIELDVEKLFSPMKEGVITEIVHRIDENLSMGKDVALFTSRQLFHVDDPDGNLDIGKLVSESLVEIVNRLQKHPSFIVSKGGITSNDIASRGLGITTSRVIGQAIPGVPVLVPEDRPNLKFIVFPGNVGNEESLLEIYRKLS